MSARFDTARVRRDFARAATRYDAHAQIQHDMAREGAALLLPHLAPGSRLLDAGSGTGHAAALFSDIPGVGIIAVDSAWEMCREAQRREAAICGDIAALPLAKESFQAIFCSAVLQWVNSRAQVLEEFRRVITPAGYALIAVFGEETLKELREVHGGVSEFPTLEQLRAESSGWECVAVQSRLHVRHHADLRELMHELKAIGATDKRERRKRGLTTPAWLRRVEEDYRARFADMQGLRASWQVHYLLLRKPAS